MKKYIWIGFIAWLTITRAALAAMPVNPSYVAADGSGTTCTEVAPCALSYANTNAAAGDVVYLRAGTYTVNVSDYAGAIQPANSGSTGNLITFENYTGETPILTPGTGASPKAFYINGKDYIKIKGITFTDFVSFGQIQHGHYNEISTNIFNGLAAGTTQPFYIYSGVYDGDQANASTHNWFHHNTMHGSGTIGDAPACDDWGSLIYVGMPAYDWSSGNNTLENNTLYASGHHLIETHSQYNVVRNNIMHNEGWLTKESCTYAPGASGKYASRNIQIYDGYSGDRDGTFDLVEGNRIGHAACPAANNGCENLTLTSHKNIVRYNDLYNSEGEGIYLKNGTSAASIGTYNRIFNNTIYKNAQYVGDRTDVHTYGIVACGSACPGNIIKNNIFYDNGGGDCYALEVGHTTCDYRNTYANNWLHATGDPTFTDPDVTAPTSATKPDLTLQAASTAKDAATYLTLANGAGTNSTTLIVDDALYFQDGTWGSSLSTVQADWIRVGTVIVQISSINYATNTITLASPITWLDNAEIRLYKKSDGTQVFYGTETDMGAHEYEGTVGPWNVTPTWTGCSGTPAVAQSVTNNGTAEFTVPSGYHSTAVTDTCGTGSWTDNVYTSGAATADCAVTIVCRTDKGGVTLGTGGSGTLVALGTAGSGTTCFSSVNLTYNANESTSGSVPTTGVYCPGMTATASANSGTLARTGYDFDGWNTAADGSGTSYAAGSGTFAIAANTTLYAKWAVVNYSVSVLNFNGDNESTTITDESGKTWTAAGDAQLDTSEKKYGTASLLLDGTGDYATTPDSADFNNPNADDFTHEAWVNLAALVGAQRVVACGSEADGQYEMLFWGVSIWGGVPRINFAWRSPAEYVDIASDEIAISTGTWYHLAVVRSGGVIKLFFHGTLLGTFYGSTSVGTTLNCGSTGLIIGARYGVNSGTIIENLSGRIDGVRISKGIARWTENFTPPAAEFPYPDE